MPWPILGACAATTAAVDASVKGMLLGLSNAIAIAVLMAVGVATGTPAVTEWSIAGGGVWNAHGGPPPAEAVLWGLLIWGVPAGMTWGVLIGAMIHRDDTPPWQRACAYVMCANCAMLVSSRLWPELLPHAFIPTTVHALVLARWTRPHDPFAAPTAFALVGNRRDRIRSWT